MKSSARGRRTSVVEILNISASGVWVFVEEREYFAAFEHFPWFRHATVGDILDVENPHKGHLYWPRLDVDLSVESLADPDKFPKVASVAKVAKKKKRATLQRPLR